MTERLRHRLNEQTPGVTECAWPGCQDRQIRGGPNPNGGYNPGLRFGILCWDHAHQIAEAVFEDQVWAAKFHQEFGQRQEPVDKRRVERMRREQDRERQEEKQRAGQPGLVYYLQVGERIKIGFSANLRRRLRAYPPESKLLAVEPGSPDLEVQRHRQFVGSLTHGREWFRPSLDLMELVNELVAVHGSPSRYAHHYRKNQNPVTVRRTA